MITGSRVTTLEIETFTCPIVLAHAPDGNRPALHSATMGADHQHRPWPIPTQPWVLRMRWHDLCFMHWRVDLAALRPLIPPGLSIDTFDGSAWIGVVPFRMTDVSARGTPRLRRFSDFAELNVRTYVTAGGKPGVWFFSLDATQPLAVRIARRAFHLPYLDAQISMRDDGGAIRYASRRTHLGAGPAELGVTYKPTGAAVQSHPGTLEYFLTERYCLYAQGRERLTRLEIAHPPWPLQPATAAVTTCTMAQPLGIRLDGDPELVHFAKRLDVIAWAPRGV